MLFPKFIIEDGNLIMMKVSYHKHIVTNKEKVRGGGWFAFNSETNTFTFYGKSEDFGRATLYDIQEAVKNSNVFTNPLMTRSIANKHKFQYQYELGHETVDLKVCEDNDGESI